MALNWLGNQQNVYSSLAVNWTVFGLTTLEPMLNRIFFLSFPFMEIGHLSINFFRGTQGNWRWPVSKRTIFGKNKNGQNKTKKENKKGGILIFSREK